MDLRTIEGGDGLPPEPDWARHYSDELDIVAAREERGVVVREMQSAETLAVANGHAIRRLVEFRIQWRRASEHVAEYGAIINGKTTGKGGQWNPHWSVMRQADDTIRALEAELGLAPRRRSDVRSWGIDAMRLKDAASSSFDCFNNDLKERRDDTFSSIDLQRTVYLCGSGAEQEQLAFGDPGSGAG